MQDFHQVRWTKRMSRILVALLFVAILGSPAGGALAAVSDWQKGSSIVPRWDTDFASETFKQSVQNLKGTNANSVTLIVPYYQSNIYSTDLHRGWNTPTDESLIAGINYVHSLGMAVNLKPHVDPYDGNWRALINPGDRQAWFSAYGGILNKYATLAANNGVEELTIGAELISMAADDAHGENTARWKSLISGVKSKYSGKLTYSSNWGDKGWTDEKWRIKFWPELDYIGISAYYPLPDANKTVEGYKREWDRINQSDIKPLQQTYSKPVLFTEIGYRSTDWAQWKPFEFAGGGAYDPQNQANLYEALFSYWNTQDFMKGVHGWEWSSDPNAGGAGDIGYTPQHKLAEETMRTWYSGGGTEPTGDIIITGSVTPQPVQKNQAVTLKAAVENKGSALNGAIIDFEVYSVANNTRVFQTYLDNQTLSGGNITAFSAPWTPSDSGDYVLRIGVFMAGWSGPIAWHHDATRIVVSADSAPTTPPPKDPPTTPVGGSIDIWWPTDGASITGSQPFKGMVPGATVDQYAMYWQVDGDRLNDMYNSFEDYPHKEAWVDVSGWNWRGEGPYTLTFTAKDSGGSTIGAKDEAIFIK